MIEFPLWSDLGMDKTSPTMLNSWERELVLMERYRYYFDGDVFEETVPTEDRSTDPPLMYPLGLNLVKMLCTAQADAIFGEWEGSPVLFSVQQDENVSNADKIAIDLAHAILRSSNGASMLWEHDLDRNVYGGGALKISPSLHTPGHIRWTRIPRQHFFPVWDPDDPDSLLEVYVIMPMTAEQARAKYGYESDKDVTMRVEHWTQKEYRNYLDQKLISKYSGLNPWGVVPFVFTPRVRFHTWYGDALSQDIIPAQDELNARLADIGEAINYNAHPVRWGMNLPRDFNAKNFPIGPNAFWNIGRSIGSNPEPKVGILEAKEAISPAAFTYVDFVYDWSRTSVFAPPIAFGEDDGGGQRSGATLEIRMWPLIKSIRRSRSYLSASLSRALHISAVILNQKKFSDVPVRAVDAILNQRIVPYFHPIMPRDQAAIVDEVVKLNATNPPSISLETAQRILGRGSGEVERIKEMLGDDDLYKREEEAAAAKAQEAGRKGKAVG